jgi:chromosome segregation ATPase
MLLIYYRCTDDHIAKLEARIASMEAAESVAGDLFNHEEKIFEKDRQIEELEIQIAQMRENASEKDRVLLEQVDMMTNNIEKLGSELSRQKEESTSNIVERDQRLTRGAILLIELQKSNRSFREIAYTAKRSCAELQLEFDTLHAQYVFLKSKSQEAELKVIEQFEKKADAVKREKEQVVKSFQDILKNRVRMYNKLKRAYDEFEDKRDAYEARAKIVERLECMVEALGRRT